jgi:hypothetical protein
MTWSHLTAAAEIPALASVDAPWNPNPHHSHQAIGSASRHRLCRKCPGPPVVAVEAAAFLNKRVHLLILDLLPPGRRDPNGIHSSIWKVATGEEYAPPPDKPLTLVSYESAPTVRAFVRPIEVGSPLPDMPLFLGPNVCVNVPLERTYETAFAEMPLRWRRVLEP